MTPREWQWATTLSMVRTIWAASFSLQAQTAASAARSSDGRELYLEPKPAGMIDAASLGNLRLAAKILKALAKGHRVTYTSGS